MELNGMEAHDSKLKIKIKIFSGFRSCEHEAVKPKNSYYTWLGQHYIQLNCETNKDGVRVNLIQKRRGGVNGTFFDRPWADYKTGFGEGK